MNSAEAHFLLYFLHQACFSEEGSLYQLNHHMDVLRELCEELTSQKSQQEVRRALKDYEQKIERLRKCASEIRMTLQPTMGGSSKNKLVLQKNNYASGKNKMRLLTRSNAQECSVFSFRRCVSSSVLICSFDSSPGRPRTRLRMEEGVSAVKCHLQNHRVGHQPKRCEMWRMYFRSIPNEKGQVYSNPLLVNCWSELSDYFHWPRIPI